MFTFVMSGDLQDLIQCIGENPNSSALLAYFKMESSFEGKQARANKSLLQFPYHVFFYIYDQ